MNVLIIESDKKLRQAAKKAVETIYRRKLTSVEEETDLPIAVSRLACVPLDGPLLYDLIICAETVDDSDLGEKIGNGLAFMKQVRDESPTMRELLIVILSNKDIDNIPNFLVAPRYTERPIKTMEYLVWLFEQNLKK